jgi:two-component system, cell cycle sensor histidine kinase and response regulator CckA
MSVDSSAETAERSLLEKLPDAAFVLDATGTIRAVNERLCRLVERAADELVGEPVETLEPRDLRHWLAEEAAAASGVAASRREPTQLEARLRCAGGGSLRVVLRATFDAGAGDGSSVVLVRLPGEARHSAAAGDAERRFRRSIEMSPAGVYRTTITGTILECNQSFATIFGYASPAELEGTDVQELYWEKLDRPKILELLRARRELPRVELTGRRRDGEQIRLLAAGRLVEESGVEVIETTILDVTDLRRTEEQLRERELVYRSLVDSTQAVLWRADPATFRFTFVSASAQALLGYSPSRWLDEPDFWVDHLHPEDRVEAVATCRRETANGRDHLMEYRMIHADGRSVWVQDSGSVVMEGGKPVSLVGAMIDISKRKLLEEQLQLSQRIEAVGRLTGGIAHDFNNLVGVISGYAELLLDEMEADDPERQALYEIREAAARASLLTRQMLAFSRRQVLRPRKIDLNRLVRDFERMIRRVLGEDVVLRTELTDGLWPVRADPVQIEQVLLNLAVNARDAMPGGGRLEIGTSNVDLDDTFIRIRPGAVPGSFVRLAIRDSGVGMDAETLSHVFEPFFSTKEPGKGSGLGLSTVYGIVKQSGGYIEAASRPGDGSEFTIYLPREGVREDDELEPPTPRMERLRGSETVLVVEDSQPFLRLVRQILERAGYRVLAADSPEVALESFRGGDATVDLLLTDLVMPGMSGRELAQELHKLRPDLKILFMSGYSSETIGERSPDEPELLQKPFSSQELLETLRATLAGREPDVD